MVGQSAFCAVGFIRITVGNRAWPGRSVNRSDHLICVLGRLRFPKRQSATGGPSCGKSRLFAWATLQPESERFMVPKSIPREGATAGYHAVLTRRETIRFSDAWLISENWLGWQGSNLRMSVPKTDALPLGYTPAVRAPIASRAGKGRGSGPIASGAAQVRFRSARWSAGRACKTASPRPPGL